MKPYYYGVDIIKLVCAIMVVSIHTTALLDIGQAPYSIFHNYITRFAVPFFFVSSGFFFSLSFCKVYSVNDKKKKVRSYVKRLARPFCLWGSLYFVLSILELVIIDKEKLSNAFLSKLHLLAVESPGAGLWYIEALLWIMLLMAVTAGVKKQTHILALGFICLNLLSGIWNAPLFGGGAFAFLHNVYYQVFLSERTFLFYGAYFFIGVLIAEYSEMLSKMKVTRYLGIMCCSYALFVLLSLMNPSLVVCLFTQIMKLCVSASVFLYALSIKNDEIPENFLKRNARAMSTIIYFSHFAGIYFVKIVFKFLRIEFSDHCTMAFVLCSFLLLLYSVLILKFDKKKQIITRLY